MVLDTHKSCLTCGYVLDHLPEPRCPECGRGFDPDDPSTHRPPGDFKSLCVAAAWWGAAVVLCGLAMYVVGHLGWIPGHSYRRMHIGEIGIYFGALIELGVLISVGLVSLSVPIAREPKFGEQHARAFLIGLPVLLAAFAILYLLPQRL